MSEESKSVFQCSDAASTLKGLSSCLRNHPENVENAKFRRVSFPKEENLVTGYLEPANPWEYDKVISKVTGNACDTAIVTDSLVEYLKSTRYGDRKGNQKKRRKMVVVPGKIIAAHRNEESDRDTDVHSTISSNNSEPEDNLMNAVEERLSITCELVDMLNSMSNEVLMAQ
uniref:Uncharacterized protein n=1 Tax=Timema douglasi TaxID=61478 RepID=A0A7R8V9C1_TIMDO|nr:unnamed protein product [Timema douglasi]